MLVSQYYMGRFYVRSEVTHKASPDYCAGKSVLHGKILRKNFEIFPYKVAKFNVNTGYFTSDLKSSHD